MEQMQSVISAEELFGSASNLVQQRCNEALSGIASLGTLYQVATAVVALLFISILVRYFDLFRYLLLSFISKKTNRSDIHIYAAEVHNIEVFTSIAGISLLSLLTMRLSVMEEVRYSLMPLYDLSVWQLGGLVFGAIFALVVAERAMLYIVGVVSENKKLCEAIGQIKLLYFSITIILLAPMLILALLTDESTAQIALFVSVAICLISLILFIKDTFLLFQTQRFSIFHWILYLCALEIFPLSLLFAPILRG